MDVSKMTKLLIVPFEAQLPAIPGHQLLELLQARTSPQRGVDRLCPVIDPEHTGRPRSASLAYPIEFDVKVTGMAVPSPCII